MNDKIVEIILDNFLTGELTCDTSDVYRRAEIVAQEIREAMWTSVEDGLPPKNKKDILVEYAKDCYAIVYWDGQFWVDDADRMGGCSFSDINFNAIRWREL